MWCAKPNFKQTTDSNNFIFYIQHFKPHTIGADSNERASGILASFNRLPDPTLNLGLAHNGELL